MVKAKMKDYGKIALGEALRYRGKIQVIPKVPIKSQEDFAIWYTPGVAQLSKAIYKNKELVFDYTWKWNTIAIVTDGSRVLGLGNVGPEASLPVMEGKALLFKYLGGVDAIPLPIASQDKDKIVELVKLIEPAFGGINLEDIESPKCFYVLEKLSATLNIPVWHDDQQGTAGAVLAGLINALKLVGKRLKEVAITFVGAGAANIAIAKLLISAGADPKSFIFVDSKGILHLKREDMKKLKRENPWKYRLATLSNIECRTGGIKEALKGADVLIAASRPGPGVVKKEWIKLMRDDPIIFALANPVPEIWPWEAKEAGARVVATGRSDLPNQINNSLIFPSIFRGALDVRSKRITDGMIIAAAKELASFAEKRGINEDYIIPKMTEWEVYPRVAASVAVQACKEGVSRISVSWKEEYNRAYKIIELTRRTLVILLKEGLIK